jgi:ABC-type antimicrobial peptide transport system permease subunit
MEAARDLGPDFKVEQVRTLDEAAYLVDLRGFRVLGFGFATVVHTLVLFSAAGIHTLVAFTAARRHRELGIRSAMGAPHSRLIAEAFRRDLVPVVVGAVVGGLVASRIDLPYSDGGISVTAFSATAAFMVVVGVLAVAGPARRIIGIDPSEALREN